MLLGAVLAGISSGFAAEPKWQARVPAVAQDPALWTKLLSDLQERSLEYGAMAAAQHMIALLPDLASKEAAYKAVISIIDEGYPVPVRDIFVPGDLEPDPSSGPEAYQFANSYYLYKALLSKEKGADHWASVYLDKVDKENFPKYLLFAAIDSYSRGNLPEAEQLLNKALSKDIGSQPRSYAIKVTRTLARIYFEEGEYAKSLEIYNDFLLKLNPIAPSDWLEAAWDQFHLKHYPEALGLIYNLESKVGAKPLSLEKFNLRALVYRSTCSIPSMEELIQSFDQLFKPVLDGIKKGEPLETFAILKALEIPENAEYNDARKRVIELLHEEPLAKKLPGAEGPLAAYVYHSELRLLEQRLRSLTPDALNRTASQILNISEQMRFLRFDIERSKFNPDLVFKPVSDETGRRMAVAPSAEGGDSFEIRWIQSGDFWLDERNKYKGVITDQCAQ
jgi:tetratricopeptide (TPR) repeat protein